MTATTGANTINAAAANNVITAATTNAMTGGTGNSMTATANGNTLSANSATGSNVIEATNALGTNSITAGATNTITGGTGNTMTATTGANTINAAAANNVIMAATTNAITGGTGNTMTATTGSNTMTSAAGANTVVTNATGSATGTALTGTGGTDGVSLAGTVGVDTANATLSGATASYQASSVANGARGLAVNANVAGVTSLTGGDTGVLAPTATATMGAAAVAGGAVAQVQLGGANASLVNNTGHGVAVSATQTVISGGTTSTSLTLTDGGAAFANTTTGGPVRVTGVADGSAPFDAVNYRQLREVAQGVASTVAMANIPQVSEGQTGMVGVGVGTFNGETSLAVGASYRFAPQAVMKVSLGLSANGGSKTAGIGAGWGW